MCNRSLRRRRSGERVPARGRVLTGARPPVRSACRGCVWWVPVGPGSEPRARRHPVAPRLRRSRLTAGAPDGSLPSPAPTCSGPARGVRRRGPEAGSRRPAPSAPGRSAPACWPAPPAPASAACASASRRARCPGGPWHGGRSMTTPRAPTIRNRLGDLLPGFVGPPRHGSPADDGVRGAPSAAGRPRLGGSGFQHAEQAPGNHGRGHSLPGLAGAADPADRQ